jgi:transposase
MMAQIGSVVAGIDVAKGKVDACIRAIAECPAFQSTAEGRRQLVAWLRKHEVTKAVMEASGGYEKEWAKALRKAGIDVWVVDPKRVRNFALSAGRMAKNDKIDADTIAWFAETFKEGPSQIHDADREELQALVKARLGVVDMRARLRQSDHVASGLAQKANARILKHLDGEIAKFEAAICAKVKSTPDLAGRAEIIASVPGLGEVSAANLVAGMPELGRVSDKVAAALVGVAPYDDDSGKRRGDRHVKAGRRWVRNAIYMPCVGAATLNNPVLKAYFRRLIARGKEPKIAIIACMRKLIVILNTMLARRQKWDPRRGLAIN